MEPPLKKRRVTRPATIDPVDWNALPLDIQAELSSSTAVEAREIIEIYDDPPLLSLGVADGQVPPEIDAHGWEVVSVAAAQRTAFTSSTDKPVSRRVVPGDNRGLVRSRKRPASPVLVEDADGWEMSTPLALELEEEEPAPSRGCVDGVVGKYVDEEFPANISSIDGRASSDNANPPPTCKCGKAAKLCTVRKNGVNQGRLFWGCPQGEGKRCHNSFAWATTAPHSKRHLSYTWERLAPEDGYVVAGKKGFRSQEVVQGSVGDCWFLGALAILAEHADLIERNVVTKNPQRDGHYKIRLFIDGRWRSYDIDDHLPLRPAGDLKSGERGALRVSGSQPRLAFCKCRDRVLWPCLMEKAYAKAHGSYHATSGGWVAEALFDLTAFPTESVWLDDGGASLELWARLLSFHEQSFLMGAACPRSGQGLVGCHAYSILDVRELTGVTVGRQAKLSEFFSDPADSGTRSSKQSSRAPVRLLRLRNPWGEQEWKGEFAASSMEWTAQLRNVLEQGDSNDGTFWIPFDEFTRRFSSVDVCKAHRNWFVCSFENSFSPGAWMAEECIELRVITPTWLYITLAQPTKRGKTRGRYWFTDTCLAVLRVATDGRGMVPLGVERVAFSGQSKTVHVELLLSEPATTYLVAPFSVSRAVEGLSKATRSRPPFTVRVFSAESVLARTRPHAPAPCVLDAILFSAVNVEPDRTLATSVAKRKRRLKAVHDGVCVVIVEEGGVCLVVVVNQCPSFGVRARMLIHAPSYGAASSGNPGAPLPWRTVPPSSQAIVCALASSGYQHYEYDGQGGFAVDQLECELLPVELLPSSGGKALFAPRKL